MKKKINNQSALFEPEGSLVPSAAGHPLELPETIIEDTPDGPVIIPSPYKTYIGIDNGVSGTITIMHPGGRTSFVSTPVKVEQSYTKKKANITRIDFIKLVDLLIPYRSLQVHCILERPMVNPKRFFATLSALRCLEATLNVVELCGFAHSYIDSRKWQKELLPSGIEGDELKKASLDIGNRLFPQFRGHKHKDRDSLLMTEYARRIAL